MILTDLERCWLITFLFMNKNPTFIGTNTCYPLANGKQSQRIHLDGAASPLVMQAAQDAVNELLPHYSNSHSQSHASACLCSDAFNWSIQTILQITGASSNKDYICAVMGSGTTAWINNIARRIAKQSEKNGLVLVSALEHHANDLPHREHFDVEHFSLTDEDSQLGDIDLSTLEETLKYQTNKGKKIHYIAFSAVSNVTGIVAPSKEITALAHQYGALSLVDCAQMAAHMPLNIAETNADFVVFSGHKVYAGAAPGVLIAKQSLLKQFPSVEMGGGIVDHVGYRDIEFSSNYPARELPGTKNILGTFALATVFRQLDQIGFHTIQHHSESLWKYAFKQLNTLGKQVKIYGHSQSPRIGALSFNLIDIDHGLVAAILSDYFGIAVRNECFCAHPYVSSLLKEELWSLDLSGIPDEQHQEYINRKRGMLRASFSLYNSKKDIDSLIIALTAIIDNIQSFQKNYTVEADGNYQHQEFKINAEKYLNL